MVKDVPRAINRKFTSDNLCHLPFRLTRVKTKYYCSEHDLFDESFVQD